VKGIWLEDSQFSSIDTRGNLLTVGSEGINARYNEYRPFIKSGQVTSSGDYLVIRSYTMGSSLVNDYNDRLYYSFGIDSVISDNKGHKVGLIINGAHPRNERGIVGLGGSRENTFTGDVIVDGVRNKLYLSKAEGVTAVRADIYIKNSANLVIVNSDQILDSSVVRLSGRNSAIGFTGLVKSVSEKINALEVESGTGILSFGHNPLASDDRSEKTLILDDLIIAPGASLRIMRWQADRDHLLVRKDSEHLADALKKLTIDGWGRNQIYLKEYDEAYWSIEAAPEPSTYGALLGATGLGLAAWRRRFRSRV